MHYKALLKDSVLYIPTKVLPALTTIFFIAFLFRHLASATFVSYSVIVAISLISTQLSSGWVANSILYYLPNSEGNPIFLVRALSIMAVASVPGTLAGVAIIVWNGAVTSVVLAAVSLMVGQSCFYVLSSVFQSRRNIRAQLTAVALQCAFQVTALLIFFSQNYVSESFAVLAYATGFIVASVYYLLLILKELKLGIVAYAMKLASLKSVEVKEIVRYGSPLGLWSFFVLVGNSSDRFFLRHVADAANAASYVSAKDLLVGAAGLVTMPLLMASHPIILKLAREGKWGDAETVIKNNILVLTLLFSVYLTLVQFIGLFLLQAMFGTKYQTDVQVLLVMLFGLLFSCISMYAQKRLEATGETVRMAGVAGIVAVLGVVISWVVIPRFNAMGAAGAYAITNFLYLAVIVLWTKGRVTTFLRAENIVLPALVWIVGYALNKMIQHYAFLQSWGPTPAKAVWLCMFMLSLLTGIFLFYGRFSLRARLQ